MSLNETQDNTGVDSTANFCRCHCRHGGGGRPSTDGERSSSDGSDPRSDSERNHVKPEWLVQGGRPETR